MAFSNTYDTATPAGSDDPAEADDRMREIKAALQERLNVNLYFPLTGTEVSDADTGEIRMLTIRTLTADEVTALSATKAYLYRLVTDGELYFKDASDNTIQLTDKGNTLPNATYLKATNEADDGSVDLIKAGKNEADDTDVAIISDKARMASNAAPPEDTSIAHKKYVDDTIGVIQMVNTQVATVDTGTTVIPDDDSIPQNDEGDEYMTLAITPTSATNILAIEVMFNWSSNADVVACLALFQDSTASAIFAVQDWAHTAFARTKPTYVRFQMVAGTTSETTFKFRAGQSSGFTMTMNGHGGARKLGGVMVSVMTITELKP